MSRYLPAWLKREPISMEIDYSDAYKEKAQFSLLGPVMCGKSSIAAGLVYTCTKMSSLIPNFYAKVLPTSTNILKDANNLAVGQFPAKTDPYQPKAPEAGIVICERGWRNRKVQVPIYDTGGEITDYIHDRSPTAFTPSQLINDRMRQINRAVVEKVKDSQGFLVGMPANDAVIFRDSPSSFDVDVYTHIVLTDIIEYRRRHHKSEPNFAIVITKVDTVAEKLKDLSMDVYHEDRAKIQVGLARFMDNGFPLTSMLLKPLRDNGKVNFFRSWFRTRKKEDGSEEYWPNTRSPIIDVTEDEEAYLRFGINYSGQDYIDLVHYIGSFAQ